MSDEVELYGKAAEEIISAVAGTSPGHELQEWLSDVVRGRRARSQIKVLQRTLELIEGAGLSVRVVPDKTLTPLLEFAGLENPEDDDMIATWAALLTTAATADGGVPPAFPSILSQITPREARTLAGIHGEPDRDLTPRELADTFGITTSELGNLERLSLIVAVDSDLTLGPQPSRPRWDMSEGGIQTVGLTALGVEFVAACQPPDVL